PIPAAGPVIVEIAKTAVQLQTNLDGALDFAIGEELDHRDLLRRIFSVGPASEGGVIQVPRRLQPRRQSRHLLTDRLKAVQRAAERAALAQEGAGLLERAIRPRHRADSP